MCVCVRVCLCVRVCVRACVRARVNYKHPCTSCNGGLTMGHEWIGPRGPGCRHIRVKTNVFHYNKYV